MLIIKTHYDRVTITKTDTSPNTYRNNNIGKSSCMCSILFIVRAIRRKSSFWTDDDAAPALLLLMLFFALACVRWSVSNCFVSTDTFCPTKSRTVGSRRLTRLSKLVEV